MDDDRRGSVAFAGSESRFTVPELESFRERILEFSRRGVNILDDPWPIPDRERPLGKGGWMWFERYTDERLIQYTNEVLNGALRIYNDIVERWFPAFNKHGQMRHALPYRLVGEIRLLEGRGLGGREMATIACWNEWADGVADSGVFIEMGPKNQNVDETKQEKVRAAQDEFIKRGLPYSFGWSVLPGYGSRPATELAHKWLKDDLRALNWAGL